MGDDDIMQVLAFDLQGDFAHFRKYYTTTSPLTFLIPPRTVIIGLIGAILGLPKKSYAESFPVSECKIGVQILKPLQKVVFKENWRAGPAQLSKRSLSVTEMHNISRTPMELIKEPLYRVFFWHSQRKLWADFLAMMQERKTVYTPYLGLSEFLAEVQFVNVYEAEDLKIPSFEWIEIATVAPKDALEGFDPADKEYVETTLPNEVDSNRRFKYLKVLFERNGGTVKVRFKPQTQGFTIKELGIHLLFME